jgi:hypothetical protein
MSETATRDVTTTVDAYLAMWNEEDPARRAELIEQAWTTDGSYLDPLLEADGYAALDAMVAAVHAQYPGHRFRRTSGIDAHHDQVRFGWELAAPDGAVTVAGVDIGTVAFDGRLRSITGFFGELPEA